MILKAYRFNVLRDKQVYKLKKINAKSIARTKTVKVIFTIARIIFIEDFEFFSFF